MTNEEKAIIWNLIEKYDSTLLGFSNALSRILTGRNTDEDYSVVFSNYRKVELMDEENLDNILGDNIMGVINN